TTIPQLRSALEEAVETRPTPQWHSFSLKVEYLDWMRRLERMRHPEFGALDEENMYRLGDMELPDEVKASLNRVRRFLLREPERSHRAIRLLFANWLGHATAPGEPDRNPAVFATFRDNQTTALLALYPAIPEAPDNARKLTPHDQATWLGAAHDLTSLSR